MSESYPKCINRSRIFLSPTTSRNLSMIYKIKLRINLMCTNIVSRIYWVPEWPQSNLSKFDRILNLYTDNINILILYLVYTKI